jgi:cytochrome c-type biogenesis protein CcsB
VPVDVGLSQVSNNLINGAVVAYAVALLGYAVDAAYGNHASSAATQVKRTPMASVERVPAMAGGSIAGNGSAVDQRTAAQDDVDRPVSPASGGGISGWVGHAAVGLTVVGWLLHMGAIITRGLSVHRLPWGNMYEFDMALTFAAVTAFLVVMTRQKVRFLGLFVMLPVLLGLGLAVTVLYVPPAPLVPALHSYWLAIHVTAAIIASGIFTVGAAATVMYLVADSYATSLRTGRPARFSALARMMPAPDVLDRTAYRAFSFAFPLWTFAVIAGAIWAEFAWGHYWQWDPKETWSFITWVVFACYLHARATAGWRGRKAAIIALLGFATFLFNFFGVNFLMVGMHSYAGV